MRRLSTRFALLTGLAASAVITLSVPHSVRAATPPTPPTVPSHPPKKKKVTTHTTTPIVHASTEELPPKQHPAQPTAPVAPPASQNPDQIAVRNKILSSGVPAESFGRIMAFITKNANHDLNVTVTLCKDAHGNYDPNGLMPCETGAQQPGTRALSFHRPRYVGVIDFSRPSNEDRLFMIDLQTGEVQHYLVSHGRGSGVGKWALKFSNVANTDQSSLGLYVVGGTYIGDKGETMRLYGMESSNDAAYARGIVMHGAWYAADSFLSKFDNSRLGNSNGCPAVGPDIITKLIPLLKNGGVLDFYQGDLMDLSLTGQEVVAPSPGN